MTVPQSRSGLEGEMAIGEGMLAELAQVFDVPSNQHYEMLGAAPA